MPQQECSAIAIGLLEGPVNFLSKNVVVTPKDEWGTPTKAIRNFDAERNEIRPSGTDGELTGGYLYILEEAINGHLPAHYLPYTQENAGSHIILDVNSGSRLMFTAWLTGCAVGYECAPDGSARFSHHNIQTDEGTDDRAQKRSLSFTEAALHRIDYLFGRDLGNGVTVLGNAFVHGVLLENRWQFFYQKVRISKDYAGASWQIVEVGELEPGQRRRSRALCHIL